ncbi:hypothetical protein [Nonomuraea sp. NPDC048916]|uniref:hypothetical protein n=1 Tax=Nonomuraea sp. NPDC048916 TaxID=3154232 RepID=UPI0033E012FB
MAFGFIGVTGDVVGAIGIGGGYGAFAGAGGVDYAPNPLINISQNHLVRELE